MKNETASSFNQTITLPVTPQDTDIEEGGDATVSHQPPTQHHHQQNQELSTSQTSHK